MSVEYVIATGAKDVPDVASLGAAFPKGTAISGDWKSGITIAKKLHIGVKKRDAVAKELLPASQRKTVFLAEGDFNVACTFARHIRGTLISEDGEILESFDDSSDDGDDDNNDELPRTLLIAPQKGTAKLPDSRYVFEFMSSVGDVEGSDWKKGFTIQGIQMRAVQAASKKTTAKANASPEATVSITLPKELDCGLDDAVSIIETMTQMLHGRLLTVDGAPYVLP